MVEVGCVCVVGGEGRGVGVVGGGDGRGGVVGGGGGGGEKVR